MVAIVFLLFLCVYLLGLLGWTVITLVHILALTKLPLCMHVLVTIWLLNVVGGLHVTYLFIFNVLMNLTLMTLIFWLTNFSFALIFVRCQIRVFRIILWVFSFNFADSINIPLLDTVLHFFLVFLVLSKLILGNKEPFLALICAFPDNQSWLWLVILFLVRVFLDCLLLYYRLELFFFRLTFIQIIVHLFFLWVLKKFLFLNSSSERWDKLSRHELLGVVGRGVRSEWRSEYIHKFLLYFLLLHSSFLKSFHKRHLKLLKFSQLSNI